MDPSTYRGLTFLLSLGALPIACNPEKNDTTDGGTGGTTTTAAATDAATSGATDASTAGATAGATTGASTGASGGESSGDLVTDGATTGGTGGGATTSGETGGGETTTGGVGDICIALATFEIMCDPSLEGLERTLIDECDISRANTQSADGDACLAMLDAAYTCKVTATCDTVSMCDALFDSANACLPEPGMVCKAYAEKRVMCVPSDDPVKVAGECQSNQNFNANKFGADCENAAVALYTCFAGLSCNDLLMHIGCEVELMNFGKQC